MRPQHPVEPALQRLPGGVGSEYAVMHGALLSWQSWEESHVGANEAGQPLRLLSPGAACASKVCHQHPSHLTSRQRISMDAGCCCGGAGFS